jgi:hypothetical protein
LLDDRATRGYIVFMRQVGGELEMKYPGLVELAHKGLARLPVKPNHPGAHPHFASVTPPGTGARLLDEDRGEEIRRMREEHAA